jgi:hypothetical protein
MFALAKNVKIPVLALAEMMRFVKLKIMSFIVLALLVIQEILSLFVIAYKKVRYI